MKTLFIQKFCSKIWLFWPFQKKSNEFLINNECFWPAQSFSNKTWEVAGSMLVIMSFKWDFNCFFERSKFLEIGVSRPVFSLNKTKQTVQLMMIVCGDLNEIFSWWFAEVPKMFSMSVRWPVPPLSGSRANRPNWWFAEAP